MGGKQQVRIDFNHKVLIVEDNVGRIEWFQEKLRGMSARVATTSEEAIASLAAETPDVIFLDHDAVPVFIQVEDADYHLKTFYPVAQYLAQHQYSGTVIIHSWNVAGAIRMQFLLGRSAKVTRIPFGSFELVKE